MVNVFLQSGAQWQQWLVILLAILQTLLSYLSWHETHEQRQPDTQQVIERALQQLQDRTHTHGLSRQKP